MENFLKNTADVLTLGSMVVGAISGGSNPKLLREFTDDLAETSNLVRKNNCDTTNDNK